MWNSGSLGIQPAHKPLLCPGNFLGSFIQSSGLHVEAAASEGFPIAIAPSSAFRYPTLLAFFVALTQLTMILFQDYVLVHSSSLSNVRGMKTGATSASFPHVSRPDPCAVE